MSFAIAADRRHFAVVVPRFVVLTEVLPTANLCVEAAHTYLGIACLVLYCGRFTSASSFESGDHFSLFFTACNVALETIAGLFLLGNILFAIFGGGEWILFVICLLCGIEGATPEFAKKTA